MCCLNKFTEIPPPPVFKSTLQTFWSTAQKPSVTNKFIHGKQFVHFTATCFYAICFRSGCGMKYLSNQKEPEASLGYTLVIPLAMH